MIWFFLAAGTRRRRRGIQEHQGQSDPLGSAIVDQHAGALLAMGITAAYVRKLTTGEGTRVEGSLFAAGFDIQTEPLTACRPGRACRSSIAMRT
jgi:crotonobetainyl-CoA:carnitine CoA-transferase CaiB-like acyl-CoA transferase